MSTSSMFNSASRRSARLMTINVNVVKHSVQRWRRQIYGLGRKWHRSSDVHIRDKQRPGRPIYDQR